MSEEAGIETAERMLQAFEQTGAVAYDLTLTCLLGKKIRYRSNVQARDLQHSLPSLFEEARRDRRNLIVRPRSPSVQFIQLDDLNAEGTDRVLPYALLALETSPGNFQAWIALLKGSSDEDFARRLRKGAGADPSASGATRIAGSLNFKEKYAPHFPRVEIYHLAPGRVTAPEELQHAGLVAEPEATPARVSSVRVSRASATARRKPFPDYQRCLLAAPPNQSGTAPDVSRADFAWCMIAHDWGFGIEETAERLMELSTKAQENGEKYALMTAQNAAAAVHRRQQGRG